MARKKATEQAATAKTVVKKAAVKKAATEKKTVKSEIFVDAENAGFRAGDVYNALHDNDGAKSVKELVKLTGKTEVEVLLGIGWLLKEGKLKGEDGKVVLA
mgnify:FL=1|uniref:winged helix-turn-helix domain-containing protein n=1 Tax=Prevotella sp. TaxID=59823 RepID=UPI0040280F5A